MSTGLVFVESRHDKTRIQVKVTVPESNNSNELPAVILAHPYGPLGKLRLGRRKRCFFR